MKPGLYVATIDDRPGRVAYWNGSRYLDVESGLYFDNDLGVTDLRPLVVLDPDDSQPFAIEAAQAFGNALNVMPGRDISAGIRAIQEVISALVAPKPAEPTGLGAVVRDQTNGTWVRTRGVGHPDDARPWRSDIVGEPYRWWSDIDVAEVLSEGWSE